jgi:hypothetical protein
MKTILMTAFGVVLVYGVTTEVVKFIETSLGRVLVQLPF